MIIRINITVISSGELRTVCDSPPYGVLFNGPQRTVEDFERKFTGFERTKHGAMSQLGIEEHINVIRYNVRRSKIFGGIQGIRHLSKIKIPPKFQRLENLILVKIVSQSKTPERKIKCLIRDR